MWKVFYQSETNQEQVILESSPHNQAVQANLADSRTALLVLQPTDMMQIIHINSLTTCQKQGLYSGHRSEYI